jgi:MFS family permease
VAPLRVPACRTLFTAQAVSGVGDWAGRLALAAIVFERSDSAWWTAVVTLVALLPWLGPGQLLATLADRFGRITVMVSADLVRAAIFLIVLLPQPTWMLLVWAFLAGLCVPPFAGSRSSALVELTPSEHYPGALALFGVLSQSEIMIGYALGGVVIAVAGPETALAANAVSFLLSAAVLTKLRASAAGRPNVDQLVGLAGVRAGIAVWRADAVCRRALVMFVGVAMFMILPEALVVPYADQLDVPSGAVGLLAALVAFGSLLGVLAAPRSHDHLLLLRIAGLRAATLAAASGVLFSVGVHPVVGGAAFLVSGAVDAMSVPTNQVVGERLPTAGRAAAMAVAGGAQYSAQVVSIGLAGAAAAIWSPRLALLVGMFLAVAVSAWAALAPVRQHDAAPRALERSH